MCGWDQRFPGNLELYGPNGALLIDAGNNAEDELIAYTATNSGTFTVLVSGYFGTDTGTYVLNLAQMPEPFVVPAGDDGGTLTNGADATGTITLGDQDMWSFTANKGDSINVRLGTSGFPGNLELYGPTGALLVNAANNATDELIAYTATTNGTFTVLVSADFSSSSGIHGGTGNYVLNLAQMPEPFIVSSGDQGGAMTGSASYAGTITLGDQDMFSFTACTGDSINLGLNTTFSRGYLELYGSNGALLKSAANSAALGIAYTATNCGTFTVLVSAYFSSSSGIYGGTGTYVLTANGLSDELRECLPKTSGTNFTFNGVGGNNYANAGFVLYSTTNVATPFGLWTPVLTNQFDQFGVFDYTNIYNPYSTPAVFPFPCAIILDHTATRTCFVRRIHLKSDVFRQTYTFKPQPLASGWPPSSRNPQGTAR